MAAVLALPQGIPFRERLVAIVFGVTLVTLVMQALPFRRFLTWLGVAARSDDGLADQSRAVLIGARRAQIELDNLLASGLISRHDHAERRAGFQRDIIEAERTLRGAGHVQEDVALPAVLSARKAAIVDAARRGLISEGTAERHVAELDAQILRVTAHSHEEP
jgi:CPA1 family monovalent cation:H+ antiporter